MISDHLSGEVHLINLKKEAAPDVNPYDQVIIGGSIYAGKINRKVIKFCRDNMDALQKKMVALFICCMEKSPKREEQFDMAFPEELRSRSITNGMFGGEFNTDKMNFFIKYFVKKMTEKETELPVLDTGAVKMFAEEFKKRVTG